MDHSEPTELNKTIPLASGGDGVVKIMVQSSRAKKFEKRGEEKKKVKSIGYKV